MKKINKRINKKGFTLVELLAVIVIMGILMLVAIPAVQRYINNSKANTYVNSVKEMLNVVKNADSAGELVNGTNVCNSGTYYVQISSDNQKLLDNGGKSPFNKGDITGYVKVDVDTNGKHSYSVNVSDGSKGTSSYKTEADFNKGAIGDANAVSTPTGTICTIQ